MFKMEHVIKITQPSRRQTRHSWNGIDKRCRINDIELRDNILSNKRDLMDITRIDVERFFVIIFIYS